MFNIIGNSKIENEKYLDKKSKLPFPQHIEGYEWERQIYIFLQISASEIS